MLLRKTFFLSLGPPLLPGVLGRVVGAGCPQTMRTRLPPRLLPPFDIVAAVPGPLRETMFCACQDASVPSLNGLGGLLPRVIVGDIDCLRYYIFRLFGKNGVVCSLVASEAFESAN